MTACRGCILGWPTVPTIPYRAFMAEREKLSFAMGGPDAAMNVHLYCEDGNGTHVTRGVESWLIRQGAVFTVIAEMKRAAEAAPPAERPAMYVAIDTVASLLSLKG